MTEKELKKLSRGELLEMLNASQAEVRNLKAALTAAEEKLAQRDITIDNAGSIAEAALQLNGVFSAAQAACQQYIENIQALNDRQAEVCARVENETMEKAARILTEAETKARYIEQESNRQCTEMVSRAKQDSEEYWKSVSHRLEAFYAEHAGLREILSTGIPSQNS